MLSYLYNFWNHLPRFSVIKRKPQFSEKASTNYIACILIHVYMYCLPTTDMALYSGILLREFAIFWGISSASSTNRTDNPQSRDFTKSLIYSGSSVGRLSESTTNNVFYKRDKDLCGLLISMFIYCSVLVVHKLMMYVNTKAAMQTQCKRSFDDASGEIGQQIGLKLQTVKGKFRSVGMSCCKAQ